MPYFSVGNSQCYYESEGSGEPVLFIHGWNGNMSGFKKNLMPELVGDYQCIALDLPGFGRSDAAEISVEQISESVDKLLDHLRIKTVTLMGFCMGGVIALDYAMRQQERVKKLVLIETYADFPWFLSPLLSQKHGQKLFEFALKHPIGIFIVKRYLLMRDRLYRDDFFRTFQLANPKVSLDYIRMLWKYAQLDHNERMRKLNLKTLIVMGKETRKSVKRSICKIQNNIRGSILHALDQAGHFPLEENSAKLVEKLKTFFRE